MTTNVYAAKRDIIDRLQQLTGPGGPLEGVQVAYAFPGGNLQQVCVYGGFVQFEHPLERAAAEGGRYLPTEEAEIGLHIRVRVAPPPEDGVEHTDLMAEEIGEAIGASLADGSGAYLLGGQASYELEDGAVVSTLSYRIGVESVVK